MVQLLPLRNRSPRRCGDRIGVDGETAWPTHRDKTAMNGAQLHFPGEGVDGGSMTGERPAAKAGSVASLRSGA